MIRLLKDIKWLDYLSYTKLYTLKYKHIYKKREATIYCYFYILVSWLLCQKAARKDKHMRNYTASPSFRE